jgi:hypothetical protein
MGPPSGGGKGIDVIDTALHGRQRVFMKRRSDPGAAEPVGNAGIRPEQTPGSRRGDQRGSHQQCGPITAAMPSQSTASQRMNDARHHRL